MSTSQFADRAPEVSQLTAYDESHLTAYLRLLDADDNGDDWRETAAVILGVDAAAEPQRAKTMHDSHLARARWMTEVGYAHLLGCERSLRR
jgi:predicted secreted protein